MSYRDKEGWPISLDDETVIKLDGEGLEDYWPGGIIDADLDEEMRLYGGTVDIDFHHKIFRQN